MSQRPYLVFPHLCLHGHELLLEVLGCGLALVSLRHLSFQLGIGGGLVGTPVIALSLKEGKQNVQPTVRFATGLHHRD